MTSGLPGTAGWATAKGPATTTVPQHGEMPFSAERQVRLGGERRCNRTT